VNEIEIERRERESTGARRGKNEIETERRE
jgi:hypothetical protein